MYSKSTTLWIQIINHCSWRVLENIAKTFDKNIMSQFWVNLNSKHTHNKFYRQATVKQCLVCTNIWGSVTLIQKKMLLWWSNWGTIVILYCVLEVLRIWLRSWDACILNYYLHPRYNSFYAKITNNRLIWKFFNSSRSLMIHIQRTSLNVHHDYRIHHHPFYLHLDLRAFLRFLQRDLRSWQGFHLLVLFSY